jgi:hypothetical protein
MTRFRLPLFLFVLAVACQVSSDRFYKKTYLCDGDQPGDTCGKTEENTDMVCYKARQIGVRDFCTEKCPQEQANLSGAGWKCVDTKARMQTCRPSQNEAACQQPDTECLRTDAKDDEGVCMTVNTCRQDSDCKNPARPTCIGGLISQWYGAAAAIQTDHFSCLQTGCEHNLAACAAGEVCLPRVIPGGSAPLDICVPSCDADLNCPPNYFCFRKVSGPAAPAVCIPGIMGFRCLSDMDCLLGQCKDTGDGFNVCAYACQTNDDCLKFSNRRGAFMCATDPDGQGKHCQNWRAYTGSPCGGDKDCRSHEKCTIQNPYGWSMEAPECRARCGPDKPCQNRGGVPHVCLELDKGEATCYPGTFFIPCQKDAECVGDLKCMEVTHYGDKDQLVKDRRCSVPCQSDAECNAQRYVDSGGSPGEAGFCQEGGCVLRRPAGQLCDQDAHCDPVDRCKPSRDAAEAAQGVMRCEHV